MTLVLLLKLLDIAPTLLAEGSAAIKELSSSDDDNTKVKAAIADAQTALTEIGKLFD